MDKNILGMELNKVYHGKNKEVLKSFPDNCFDSIVTDPPYELGFMGKSWDASGIAYDVSLWEEVLRVLKPGGHLLSFGGTRTYHRMACAIEDAGFEIRDQLQWWYGSGFPKSMDISKAIDKQAEAERKVIGSNSNARQTTNGDLQKAYLRDRSNADITEPKTDEAKQWEGWGTALKPANEPICLARKPLSENTIAGNILKHGTGGINIDACRIEFKNEDDFNSATWGRGTDILGGNYVGATHSSGIENIEANSKGRFPANLILDEFVGNELDKQTGILTSGAMKKPYTYQNNGFSFGKPTGETKHFCESSEGGASRFFYCPKADNYERNKGLKNFELKDPAYGKNMSSSGKGTISNYINKRQNNHPTVKPIAIMRYLVRLITPKGGVVCDLFGGSGTTGVAAKLELMQYVLIEDVKEYCDIAEARIAAWNPDKYIPQELF